MTIASLAPTASVFVDVTSNSVATLIPTTGIPTVLLVSNMGQTPVYVQMGSSSAVATPGTSTPVMPNSQLALTIGSNTYIAMITGHMVQGVNLTVGT